MHLHFERTGNTVRSDCTILSLTWMGKVPDESPTEGTIDEGWTLNRGNYYQEGWLSSGNTRGIVGVTYTTAHTKKPPDNVPLRTNYNLRGHRAEITLVRWNEPYQKLASCDSTGIIFVWIKYEGRWSIELINDRNTQVTDFAWSHNGRMALICYQDGFVLVGSVAGQRYWSSMLNLECTISCGLWTPDDQNVYFGTTDGQVIVMDIHGTMLAQVSIQADVAITGMAWSCEKFKLDEHEEDSSTSPSTSNQFPCENVGDKSKSSSPVPPHQASPGNRPEEQKPSILAIAFKNGTIYLMKSYDEVSPTIIDTHLKGLLLEWSHSGELLAVAGYTVDSKPASYANFLKFYTEHGSLRYIVSIPNTQFAVSALTWGHNDKRLFLATGNIIHIGWVCRKVASLQLLSRLAVYNHLSEEPLVNLLPIPRRIKSLVRYLFAHTIRCYLPDAQSIREFASKPPPGGLRLHCTMIRHEEVEVTLASATNIGACYTLYLEYLGGLIPILKGKRNSKIRPEFIIFDPQGSDFSWNCNPFQGDSIKLQISNISNGHLLSGLSEDSDSDIEDSCTASPRLQRRRRMRRRMLREQLFEQDQVRLLEDVAYVDSLPEQEKLVEVTSNIWGTKFKIHGLAKFLPANLGSVTYKTSLLHLQPRQMTLIISELKDGPLGDIEPDPNFNPNSFSEDEDDAQPEDEVNGCSGSPERRGIPIAPMTPNKKQISSGTSRHSCLRAPHQSRGTVSANNKGFQHFLTLEERQHVLPPALDSTTEDEYVNFFPTSDYLSSVAGHQSKSWNQSTTSAATNGNMVKTKHPVPSSHSSQSSLKTGPVLQSHDSTSVRPKVDKKLSAKRSDNYLPVPSFQWAAKTGDLKFIDDDLAEDDAIKKSHLGAPSFFGHKFRSHSIGGHLNNLDIVSVAATNHSDFQRASSLRDAKKRLMVSQPFGLKTASSRPKLINCGKSKSLDSGSVFDAGFGNDGIFMIRSPSKSPKSYHKTRPILLIDSPCKTDKRHSMYGWEHCNGNVSSDRTLSNSSEDDSSNSSHVSSSPVLKTVHFNDQSVGPSSKAEIKAAAPEMSRNSVKINKGADTSQKSKRPSIEQVKEAKVCASKSVQSEAESGAFGGAKSKNSNSGSSSPKMSRALSPSCMRRALAGASNSILNSPLLNRRKKSAKLEVSDDENSGATSDDVITRDFKDLGSLQKAQLKQKLRKVQKKSSNGDHMTNGNNQGEKRRQFTMYNKAPLWNESSQVYQLDFGGRVTQESAKNFQIEFKGKQVMQFGRIDGNAYTLDFQYPFTALQAFAVALANVTQRLK